MKAVVGLGNFDPKYSNTRHNVGFILIDDYIDKISQDVTWTYEKKFLSDVARVGDNLFVKPQTYMNKSGLAVSKIVSFYNLKPDEIIIVHDDVDLEFGKTKKVLGSGSAGHKGVQNIIDNLKTQAFYRIRFGVGRPDNPNISIEDWVLMSFTDEELEKIHGVDLSSYLD